MSDAASISAALPLPVTTVGRPFSLSTRTLKITAAATMTIVGAYGILSESSSISTSNAVMSAYVLDVRTPIEGTVSGLPVATGGFLEKNQLIGRVDDSLTDHQHLDTLHLTEETAQAEADALTAERNDLASQRRSLLLRADLHSAAMSTRLEQQLSDSSHTLSARELALAQAASELGRGRTLHDAGILATADFEKLVSTQRVLAEEVSAQRANVRSVQAQSSAMAHGILSEPGTNNDVAYSRQRADEISIKLAENSRSLTEALARSKQTHLTVEKESSRNALLTASELRAPSSGLLWKLNAVNGEHTAPGSPVLSIVDCNRQFLIAEISQQRLSSVVLQGQARIRLSGETFERTGTVLSASSDPQRDLDHKLAAVPVVDPARELATVLISIDSLPEGSTTRSGCLVGRTARVRIPSTSTNLLSRWISDRM